MINIVIGGFKWLLFNLYDDSGGFGSRGSVLCEGCANYIFSELLLVNLTKSYKQIRENEFKEVYSFRCCFFYDFIFIGFS